MPWSTTVFDRAAGAGDRDEDCSLAVAGVSIHSPAHTSPLALTLVRVRPVAYRRLLNVAVVASAAFAVGALGVGLVTAIIIVAVTLALPHAWRANASHADGSLRRSDDERAVVPRWPAVVVAVSMLGGSALADAADINPAPGQPNHTTSAPAATTTSSNRNDATPSTSGPVDAAVAADWTTTTLDSSSPAPLSRTLTIGSAGDSVRRLQQRLNDLGFAPGPIDGVFGADTEQAVWACQTLVMRIPRANATSDVTDTVWQAINADVTIQPRRQPHRTGAVHVEIYMPEQVAIVFNGSTPMLIAHISTGQENADGTPRTWCETVTYDTDEFGVKLDVAVRRAVCAEAKTPGGVFRFTRRYAGKRVGPLGGMMNPIYFNYGLAIHGADNVPLQPASHGCVRVNQRIATVLPSLVSNGNIVYVWGEDGKQPEQYSRSESLPSFNRPDPATTDTIGPEAT